MCSRSERYLSAMLTAREGRGVAAPTQGCGDASKQNEAVSGPLRREMCHAGALQYLPLRLTRLRNFLARSKSVLNSTWEESGQLSMRRRGRDASGARRGRGRDADRSLMNYDADGPRRRRCFAGTLVRSRPPRRGCCSSEHACCTSSSPRRPRAPAAATCCLKLCGSRVGSRRRRDSWAETALSRYYVPQGRSMSRPRRQRDHVH